MYREQGCARKDELIVKIIERAFKGINTKPWLDSDLQMPAARHLLITQGLSCMLLFINLSLILSLFCLFVPPTRPCTEYPGVCRTPQAAKEKNFRHRAAGMMQRSYRQWKQGQGITEVFILAKEEVTSGANPSSHRCASLPARLTQSRAGSCMPEPLIYTFLACWRLWTPWITFSIIPHFEVPLRQITTGGGTAFFSPRVCQ